MAAPHEAARGVSPARGGLQEREAASEAERPRGQQKERAVKARGNQIASRAELPRVQRAVVNVPLEPSVRTSLSSVSSGLEKNEGSLLDVGSEDRLVDHGVKSGLLLDDEDGGGGVEGGGKVGPAHAGCSALYAPTVSTTNTKRT